MASYNLAVTNLPVHDGEPFIAALERASEAGNADYVAANLDRLERLIGQPQDRAAEIVTLQYRARVVRERHEPPAKKGKGDR